jgi:hypothetical protein
MIAELDEHIVTNKPDRVLDKVEMNQRKAISFMILLLNANAIIGVLIMSPSVS